MCIVIICFPVDDVLNFEINFVFCIMPLTDMIKKVMAKFKYL